MIGRSLEGRNRKRQLTPTTPLAPAMLHRGTRSPSVGVALVRLYRANRAYPRCVSRIARDQYCLCVSGGAGQSSATNQ